VNHVLEQLSANSQVPFCVQISMAKDDLQVQRVWRSMQKCLKGLAEINGTDAKLDVKYISLA
jgi:hypothetical protein